MPRFRGWLACSRPPLASPSRLRILCDLLNGLGECIQAAILLIETGDKLLRDRGDTLVDLS